MTRGVQNVEILFRPSKRAQCRRVLVHNVLNQLRPMIHFVRLAAHT